MTQRTDKINQTLRKEIGSIVQFEVKDPRVQFVTITHAEVSRDLQHAKVYFSVLGDESNVKHAQEGLDRAKGFIRRLVGQRIKMRYTPDIIFIFDKSLENSFRIEQTLVDIKSESQKQNKDVKQ